MSIVTSLIQLAYSLSPGPVRHFLRDNLPPRLVKRISRRLTTNQVQTFARATQALSLEAKLWGGFSENALADLEALKTSYQADRRNVAHAAWALARWYFARGDPRRAHENIVLVRLVLPGKRRDTGQILLEADCLMKLGKREEAREIIQDNLARKKDNADLALALANAYAGFEGPFDPESDSLRLAVLNSLYESEGLASIQMRDPGKPLGFDNLAANDAEARVPADAQPLVSVIMPAYNAGETLPVALDSLLSQSWKNLEILVVDDCSTDNTREVIQAYAESDDRVTGMRLEVNSGAYAARNTGLARAEGEFVTTHDSDDWSHPQKIETQVVNLLEKPDALANVTHWARAYRHLYFRGTSRPSKKWIQWNHSSLMLKRDLLTKLGGWDEVRLSADTELIHRLEAFDGRREVSRLLPSVPLSFALEDPRSLTRQGVTHARTLFHGIRREYHEAAEFWRSRAEKSDLCLSPQSDRRPFPVPGIIRSEGQEVRALDLLVIMDFNLQGGSYVSTMNYVQAALQKELRVGVFHWRRYDLNVKHPLRPELREMAQEGRIHVIAPGECVTAETVIVGYPVILNYAIDLPPELKCSKFYIVTNQMAARLYSGGDVQYDPGTVSNNVVRLFGVKPTWVPISGLVHGLMEADGRYSPIHPETWTPLIDVSTWCQRPLVWRGGARQRPVVGRHARDHYTKWPQSPETILQAYCADQRCDVALLGGAEQAYTRMERLPRNWRVHEFGAIEPREFLEGLDFFIHYPNEDYIEEFGRAVLEAMAVGLPVILPPVFERTFNSAVLYATPEEVWPTICRLWSDEQAYLSRARAGRRFAEQHSDLGRFASRLGVQAQAVLPGTVPHKPESSAPSG